MDEVKNYPPYPDYAKPYKRITNADRIRAMSDEELEKFICSCSKCEFCKFIGWAGCKLSKWLQKPLEV